jgi:hypothetical protein
MSLNKQHIKYQNLIKELQILKAELETGNTIIPIQKGRTTQINIEGVDDVINLLEYFNQFLKIQGENK